MRLLDRLPHRRPRSRRHPTPDQAYEALSLGRCLYQPLSSNCSGPPAQVGLHNNDDITVVLTCKARYGRLRKMPPKVLDRLERVLRKAFKPLCGSKRT